MFYSNPMHSFVTVTNCKADTIQVQRLSNCNSMFIKSSAVNAFGAQVILIHWPGRDTESMGSRASCWQCFCLVFCVFHKFFYKKGISISCLPINNGYTYCQLVWEKHSKFWKNRSLLNSSESKLEHIEMDLPILLSVSLNWNFIRVMFKCSPMCCSSCWEKTELPRKTNPRV